MIAPRCCAAGTSCAGTRRATWKATCLLVVALSLLAPTTRAASFWLDQGPISVQQPGTPAGMQGMFMSHTDDKNVLYSFKVVAQNMSFPGRYAAKLTVTPPQGDWDFTYQTSTGVRDKDGEAVASVDFGPCGTEKIKGSRQWSYTVSFYLTDTSASVMMPYTITAQAAREFCQGTLIALIIAPTVFVIMCVCTCVCVCVIRKRRREDRERERREHEASLAAASRSTAVEMAPAGHIPVQPYGARPVQPYGARPVQPYGARPVQPYGARPVQPYGAKPVQPYATQPAVPYATQPAVPYATQPAVPYGQASAAAAAAPPEVTASYPYGQNASLTPMYAAGAPAPGAAATVPYAAAGGQEPPSQGLML